MEIPSRQEIKDKLQRVAKEAGYSGSVVDLLVSLASTGYYETILRSIGILRESNAETAANMNSLITLAISRMYSAFRGKNPQLVVKGIPTEYQNLKRGDKIYSSESFNLYVLEDTEVTPKVGSATFSIPVIASKSFIYQSKKNSPDRFFTEFLTANISEDIILYEQTDQSESLNDNRGIEVQLTKNFREHSLNGTLFGMTIQDFGLRIYTKTPNDHNYTLSAFEYLPESSQLINDFLIEIYEDRNLDPNADLDVNIDIRNFEVTDIEFLESPEPRETIEELRNNYNTQLDSIYLIRSNSDLEDTFKLAFTDLVEEVIVKQFGVYTTSMRGDSLPSDFISSAVPAISTIIDGIPSPELPYAVFFYTPKDPSKLITSARMYNYIENVKFYYMMDHLYCYPATAMSYQVVVAGTSTDSVDSRKQIQEVLSKYDHKLGLNLTVSQLRTELSKIPSIKDITGVVFRRDSILINKIELKDWQYFSYSLLLSIK